MDLAIPTHFRFRFKKEAAEWNRTTKDWIAIHEIHINNGHIELSSLSFAWVSVRKNNLEFANKPYNLCVKCKETIVDTKGECCDECYE